MSYNPVSYTHLRLCTEHCSACCATHSVVGKSDKLKVKHSVFSQTVSYTHLEEMSKSEREWLNNYHKDVYEKIGPHLTEEEREWLKEYTRAI